MTDTPTTTPKLFCFVLMPFADEFNDVYKLGIQGACDDAGTYCERVDEQIFTGSVMERIYNQIAKADVIIADMTGQNANVFYEVGYAHALGKTTVLLTKDAADIPFDMLHFPHIVYGDQISELQDQLTTRMQYFVAYPPNAYEAPTVDIELYLGETCLKPFETVCEHTTTHGPSLDITVYNQSSETLERGAFQIGILTANRFDKVYTSDRDSPNANSIRIPTGGFVHMLPTVDTLFPQGYAEYGVTLSMCRKSEVGRNDVITLRVFTRAGTRDFPVRLYCARIGNE
ncbi:MAG: hypothetical protein QGG42_07965 [Phycisphaerae bacterium]|jgi:hypothetical protein|nr:hypothetical protein [Phycisphaerae bacterium]